MAALTDIEVLNDYGLTKRTRITSAGARKSKYSIRISSEPILIQTSPTALARGPADAIAELYRERIRNITARAAPATIRSRDSARAAVIRGEPYAMRRYSGGRTGTMVPAQSDRLFNDSGRLAKSIAVGPNRDGWVVNVAANRLDPNTLNGGEAALLRIVELLRQYVPEWGDPRAIGDSLAFRKALSEARKSMLAKADERTVELRRQLMGQLFSTVMRLVA